MSIKQNCLSIVVIVLGLLSSATTIVSTTANAADFNESIKGLAKKTGFYNVYGGQTKQAMLLEVDKLNQPFIYVSGLIQGIGSNALGLDRGQIGDSRLVQFEQIGQRIILRQLNPYYRALSDNLAEVSAVDLAFANSILFSFTIVAQQEENFLIDINEFSIQDTHGVTASLKRNGEGNYRVEKSSSMAMWSDTKAFERNTEISALVNLRGEPKGDHLRSVVPDSRFVAIKFRHSFVALPPDGYQTREFHPYSGYFPFSYQDYAQPIAKPLTQQFIYRHRLGLDQQGKVIKPVVYYLDPGVPEPVRGALLDGARWWSEAFDKAGLVGGFKVEMLPEGADPLDVRYNVIQWVHRSTRGWSYGSSVVDPRTGEILKGHVTLGSLRVKQDYLIASGLLAGQAQATEKAQQMALARIRQLSAHEVGHTLGIAHNFAASVDNRTSVMDYPHPLIGLKDHKIDLSNAYGVGAGVWDDYTIDYGYGQHTPQQRLALVQSVRQRGLKFISDRDARGAGSANPWAHLWDNGAKADVELTRLMLVRELALNNINASILDKSQAHSELREAIVPIYLLHRFQAEAASKIIGGVDYNYALSQEALQNETVDATWQRQALQAVISTLASNYLAPPHNLLKQLPPKALGFSANRESFGSNNGLNIDPLGMVEASARNTLKYLLNSARINRVMLQSSINEQQLSVNELLDELIGYTLTQSQEGRDEGMQLLVSQRVNTVVIEQLLALYHQSSLSPEAKSIVKQQLVNLQKWLTKQAKRGVKENRVFLRWLVDGLEQGIDDAQYQLIKDPMKLPPGSPI